MLPFETLQKGYLKEYDSKYSHLVWPIILCIIIALSCYLGIRVLKKKVAEIRVKRDPLLYLIFEEEN